MKENGTLQFLVFPRFFFFADERADEINFSMYYSIPENKARILFFH